MKTTINNIILDNKSVKNGESVNITEFYEAEELL
jgi:hypothetical protein